MSPNKQFEQDRARGQEEASTERLRKADRLLEILGLESIEQDLYRGLNEVRGDVRLFGGQVLAQALRAACHTVDGRYPHSVHAYFIRAGDAARPVLYEVDRIRDGRSFTTRRVVAIQGGEAIFSAAISFQRAEDGFEHTHPMPNVPPPEELEDDQLGAARLADQEPNLGLMAARVRPFAMRSIFPVGSPAWQQNRFWNPVWIRFGRSVEDADQALARCLLAYASDMGLVATALLPHADGTVRSDIQMASLDHALWIHRPVSLNDWLLFHKRTSVADGARGLVHADFYTRDGGLVASVSQEGLIRRIG